MECRQCGATTQRGRFCVGCGKRLPRALQPMRPVRLAPRHEPAVPEGMDLDLTQPVLRLDTVAG